MGEQKGKESHGCSLCEHDYPSQGPGQVRGLSRADNVPDSLWVPRTLWEPTMDGAQGDTGVQKARWFRRTLLPQSSQGLL